MENRAIVDEIPPQDGTHVKEDLHDDDINEVEAVTLEARVVVAQLPYTLKGVCTMLPGKGLYEYLLSLS